VALPRRAAKAARKKHTYTKTSNNLKHTYTKNKQKYKKGVKKMKNLEIELFKETYATLRRYRHFAEKVGEKSEVTKQLYKRYRSFITVISYLGLKEQYLNWRELQ
jgi:hypothetical protein